MHAPPATTAKGSVIMHFHTTSYRLHSTWPTDLPLALADTSVASSKNVFHEALHLFFIEQRKQSPHLVLQQHYKGQGSDNVMRRVYG